MPLSDMNNSVVNVGQGDISSIDDTKNAYHQQLPYATYSPSNLQNDRQIYQKNPGIISNQYSF